MGYRVRQGRAAQRRGRCRVRVAGGRRRRHDQEQPEHAAQVYRAVPAVMVPWLFKCRKKKKTVRADSPVLPYMYVLFLRLCVYSLNFNGVCKLCTSPFGSSKHCKTEI